MAPKDLVAALCCEVGTIGCQKGMAGRFCAFDGWSRGKSLVNAARFGYPCGSGATCDSLARR